MINEADKMSNLKKDEFFQTEEGKTYKVYPKSFAEEGQTELLMFKKEGEKFLFVKGNGPLFDELEGKEISEQTKIVPANHANRLVLNKFFEYTKPRAFGNKVTTMGVGDRLGLASPGHIEIMRQYKVKPVLAQQSIRELSLTERDINDVLDSAAYATLQEGYTGGFGADGDHLKLEEDIKLALDSGMSMLTLDCSDYIRNEVPSMTVEEQETEYNKLSSDVRDHYESKYLDKTFDVEGMDIAFDKEELVYNVLLYLDALNYMEHIYKEYIQKADHEIDFEISIDETETVTKPESHFFVAEELISEGVKVNSLAPRFIGEFQKGVDYMGDLVDFEADLKKHALIARHFDYKLSIHSGSDKFSAFPIIAKHTNGLFHLKTAGTNWLEAVRVLAKHNTDLFRRMHRYAFEHFPEAQAYYHITPDLDAIKPLDEVSDEDLPEYMNDRNARQVWHVTYGVLLTATDEEGNRLFKPEFFENMDEFEEEYKGSLASHIGKHLETLQIPKATH
ncbi:tagaturonate epimerase family protein [Jeotgalibaca sp. MA1X17-3]|uniref:tagaturonate epimerase family protein n=1 Tax=Jeotgalibaca sp. MA1X17-3 TaxID=2908211 RepID=UPI002883263E|nr:tagaturonate epimerase family protein [Jeotgalibaca sp. MA1X17-3]